MLPQIWQLWVLIDWHSWILLLEIFLERKNLQFKLFKKKNASKLNTRIIFLFFILTWLINFTHEKLANLSYPIFTKRLCTFIQHDLAWTNLRITNNRIKTFFRHNQITLSICNKISPTPYCPFEKNYIKKLYYFCLFLLLMFPVFLLLLLLHINFILRFDMNML